MPTLTAEGWLAPHPIQQQFLHSFRPRNYFIGGRGSGKTAVACKKAEFLAALSPGIIIIITEPTVRDIKDVLIPCWAEVVTKGTYTEQGGIGDRNMMFANGSQVWFRSRQSRRISDDPPFRGPTVGWIIHDELALDRREDVLEISEMMLRQKSARWLGCDVVTTPKPNWLYREVLGLGLAERIVEDESNRKQVSEDGQSAAFYAATDDNPHNRGLHGRMQAKLSDSFVRQELLGEWVSREGQCWQFVDAPWPLGNIVDSPFDNNRPWILAGDLGGSDSAWGIYQKEDLTLAGRKMDCIVLKAEWTPHQVYTPAILQEIKAYTSNCRYPSPAAIKIGADYKTPGGTGDTPEMMFAHLGWNSAVETITGWHSSKDVQDIQASTIVCNVLGERRFCVSSQLESFYPGPTRGLLDVMRHDTYPDAGQGKHYFRKEKDKGIFHEDSRDHFLYMAVSVYPPSYNPTDNWAAA